MRALTASLHYLTALALPPRCPACGDIGDADHRFCGPCWSSLTFLGPPWCAACQHSFEVERGDDALCDSCHAARPPHDGVRAAVAYGDVARSLALRLKYGGRLAFADTAARAMARLMPPDADLLVPVPLHRWRIWTRGFNQAALIAAGLSRSSGTAMDLRLLTRIKATPPLRNLGARRRASVVAGAFALAPDRDLTGLHIVLVDDIHTSGATTNACTRVLKAGGAARVTILCWARVVGTDAPPDD